jgi:glucose dehydrogenase
MKKMGTRFLAIAFAMTASSVWAQSPTDWPETGNYGNAKYSPLDYITPENVDELEVAWVYEVEPQPGGRGYNTTPIMVDNMMFFPKENFSTITAIAADTGEEIWSTVLEDIPGVPEGASVPNRGISYWGGTDDYAPRIVLGLSDGFLVQLDAYTGNLIAGPAGVVNLSIGIMDKFGGDWRVGAPAAIYKNTAIVAGRTGEQGRYGIPGDPRSFDLITGEELWRFHVVPRPGELNYGTWGEDGWQDRRGPGVWSPMAVDEENGLVFFPMGNATDQNYGGSRPGDNLYAASLLVLHAETGEYAWHWQYGRHDIFDWDLSAPPTLMTTFPDGEPVPSVAQMTKQGLLFVHNRLTGEPIWGIEDMPVPIFDAPGDYAAPTQPYPVKPVALARNSMDRDEVWDGYNQEHTDYCTALYDRSWQAGPHTPYGMLPSLVFPGSEGGGSWSGVASDDERQLVFANARDMGVIAQLRSRSPDPLASFGKSKMPTSFYVGPSGYPCTEPPWSSLYAIDTATGDIVWQQPVGEYEELTAMGITGTGTATAAGAPVATAGGVVFIGASNDAKIRAFDSESGDELWSAELDGMNARATPMVYMGADGQQYVVAIAGGGDDGFNVPERERGMVKFFAYRLPE